MELAQLQRVLQTCRFFLADGLVLQFAAYLEGVVEQLAHHEVCSLVTTSLQLHHVLLTETVHLPVTAHAPSPARAPSPLMHPHRSCTLSRLCTLSARALTLCYNEGTTSRPARPAR